MKLTSFQGIKRSFVLAFVIAQNAPNKEAGIKTAKSILFQEQKLINTIYWLIK